MATISTDNYNIGGIDLYFKSGVEDGDLDAGTANGQGSTFRTAANNLGNIVMAEFAPDVVYLEHFITTSAGDRRKDHTIASQKALTIPFTFDEINEANLMKYFMGTDMSGTATAASPVFSVMTNTLDYGSAQLYFRTDIGNDFIYFIPKCTIRSEGNLSMDIESWWQAGMVLDVFYYAWTPTNIGGGETYYGCLSTKSIS